MIVSLESSKLSSIEARAEVELKVTSPWIWAGRRHVSCLK